MSHRGNGFTGFFAGCAQSLRQFPRRLFQRREIMVRSAGRVRYLPMPAAAQIMVVGVIFAAGAWVGHTTHIWFDFDAIIESKNRLIATARVENRELLGTMARMRTEFSDVAGTLERNHADLEKLVVQNGDLRRTLSDVRATLGNAESQRTAGEQRQAALRQQIASLEARLSSAENRSATLSDALQSTRSALAETRQAKTSVETAGETLRKRVAGLERRLLALRESQHSLVGRATEKTAQDVERIERIILRAGLDVGELLARVEDGKEKTVEEPAGNGQGGPFIPLAEAASATTAEGGDRAQYVAALESYDKKLARWEALQRLIRSVPLVAPLEHYKLSSGYGKRKDPINGKMGMHEGIDLTAERRTPIHATAPGKIVFAGWHGRYGRIIEIDHGYGIRTRYAHLHRILVRRGQNIAFGQNIGQVGTTGRSTGAHLHYEIIVDGKSVDPERFMRAGRNVFKG